MKELSIEEIKKYGERYMAANKDRIEKVINDGLKVIKPDAAEDWKKEIVDAVMFGSVDDRFGGELDSMEPYEKAVAVMSDLKEGKRTPDDVANEFVELINDKNRKNDTAVYRSIIGIYSEFSDKVYELVRAKKQSDAPQGPNNG